MDRLDVSLAAVSSTTTCEENYAKVISEMLSLTSLGRCRIIPVLWVTPFLLDNQEVLSQYLQSGIRWSCVKIHGALHEGWFTTYSKATKAALRLARQLEVPILLHTGEVPCCEPNYYSSIISQHKRQLFILAHSRPVNQAINVLRAFSNVYVDTAFCPIEDVIKMVDNGFSDRILWGTDIPIQLHYYGEDINLEFYYKELISSLKMRISQDAFIKITSNNFQKVFGVRALETNCM